MLFLMAERNVTFTYFKLKPQRLFVVDGTKIFYCNMVNLPNLNQLLHMTRFVEQIIGRQCSDKQGCMSWIDLF